MERPAESGERNIVELFLEMAVDMPAPRNIAISAVGKRAEA